MSILRRRPSLRWIVPLLAVIVLASAGSAVGFITASARGGLPDRSAAALLVDVQKARVAGLSGTIVENADLGLPSLPGLGGGTGSSDLTSLVSGSHTLRLWYAGPNKVRVALQGSLGESDVVRDGPDLWTWSSATKSATHRRVPASSASGAAGLAGSLPLTPQLAADAALQAITPSTRVSTDGTAVVAGRSAYELVLRPRSSDSLVGSVRIAIDGKTHVPTRVQVYAKNAKSPSLQVGFTSFDPTTPDPSVFGFNPPPGTKVTQGSGSPLGGHDAARKPSAKAPDTGAGAAGDRPTVVGQGWSSVVVAPVPTGKGSGSGSLASALKVLPTVSGSWGSGPPAQGHAVLGSAHRPGTARRRGGRTAGPLRRAR